MPAVVAPVKKCAGNRQFVLIKMFTFQVGDHIEKLDGENMVGKRHYEVAKILKDIPKGTTFTIRLVEPLKSGFGSIGPKTSGAKSGRKQNYGSGKETLRFKANGQATIENDVSYFFGLVYVHAMCMLSD